MRYVGVIFSVILGIVGAITLGVAADSNGGNEVAFWIIGGIMSVSAVILFVKCRIAIKKKRSPKSIERKAARKEIRQERKAARWDNYTIDQVMIAGQESRTKTGSAIGRGAVGGALLGPLGMVAGAAGAKKNTTVTLIIRYKSGRTETKAVKLNSSEFKKYAKYIKMD